MNLEGFASIEADLKDHIEAVKETLEQTQLEFPPASQILTQADSSIEFISVFQGAQCRVGNWNTRNSLKRMQVIAVIRAIETECDFQQGQAYTRKLHKYLTDLSDCGKMLDSQYETLNSAIFSLKSIQSCATARRLYEE